MKLNIKSADGLNKTNHYKNLVMNFRNGLILIVLSCVPRLVTAQSLRDIEQHIKRSFASIERCQEQGVSDDSISVLTGEIRVYLEKTLTHVPRSLTARLHLPEGMWIATSPDHKMRSWCWNTWTGGSMPQIEVLVEYSTPKGIRVDFPFDSVEGGNDSWFDKIYCVQARNGMTYYLPTATWVGDGRHVGKAISAYAIEDTVLNAHVKLFKTKSELLDGISLGCEDCPAPNITFSADGNTLYIPLIKGKEKERITSKYLVYKFDGDHYVYKGVSKHTRTS